MTFTGNSLKPNNLLVAICIPVPSAKRGISATIFVWDKMSDDSIASGGEEELLGTMPLSNIIAGMRMSSA